MNQSKKILFKIIIDFLLYSCVSLPILVFHLWVDPFERGFICNDQALIHPYKENTISVTLLISTVIPIPIAIILITELARYKLKLDDNRSLDLFGWDVPIFVQNLYKYIGYFLFGAAVCQLTTDIAKYSVGLLRPHFISVCMPVMDGGGDCNDVANLHKYIENFRCSNPDATDHMLKDMRLSFPSGHASIGFFTMLFCAFYLQKRFNWKGSMLLKHVLQFALVLYAFYAGLSRISDYKHRGSDVLAGSVLGIVVALVVGFGITDIFVTRKHQSEKLPLRT